LSLRGASSRDVRVHGDERGLITLAKDLARLDEISIESSEASFGKGIGAFPPPDASLENFGFQFPPLLQSPHTTQSLRSRRPPGTAGALGVFRVTLMVRCCNDFMPFWP
jgi:hypothetical protein